MFVILSDDKHLLLPGPFCQQDADLSHVSQVKPELATVSNVDAPTESFARCNYEVSCEHAMNEQVWDFVSCLSILQNVT